VGGLCDGLWGFFGEGCTHSGTSWGSCSKAPVEHEALEVRMEASVSRFRREHLMDRESCVLNRALVVRPVVGPVGSGVAGKRKLNPQSSAASCPRYSKTPDHNLSQGPLGRGQRS